MMKFQAGDESPILVERKGNGVVHVRINRPAKKNAMTFAMWRDLASLFERLSREPATRAIVLAGVGRDFCAGADIGEFDTVRHDADTARGYERSNSDAFAAVRTAPVPTIAAISGVCFGGGFGLASACDLRLASADALFSVPAARLGLAYPQDAMSDIVHAVGPQLAKYLAFSAARLTAEQALGAGFLMEIAADPATLAARADELAGTIAQNAPLSVRASKSSIRAVLSLVPEDAEHARALGDATFDSRDYGEGRAAFRERREPEFTGE